MRIDRTNVGHVMGLKPKQELRTVKETDTNSEEVIVSPQLQEKLASASQQQAAKATRIEELREQFQSGTYKINFDKLANKLIEEETNKL